MPRPAAAEPFGTVLPSRVSLTLRQLRAFVALAHAHSFTAAAAQLHLTQSALSALVRELESEVGSRLFDRTTRSVDINAAGRELLPVAERVLRDLEGGVQAVRELRLNHRGSLSIAATPHLAASFLPGVCAQLQQRFPALRLHDRLAADNLQSVRAGEADLAIGSFGPVSEDIVLTPLGSGRMGVAVPAGHRFARRRSLRLADLQDEPLILLSRDSAFRATVDHALAQAGLAPPVAFDVAYLGTAIGLVEAGLGVAPCPSHVAPALQRAGLRFIALAPPIDSGVAMAALKGRALSAAAQAFLEIAQAAGPPRGPTAPRPVKEPPA
jgi:DNA-binding transcriptional LysR family regulator